LPSVSEGDERQSGEVNSNSGHQTPAGSALRMVAGVLASGPFRFPSGPSVAGWHSQKSERTPFPLRSGMPNSFSGRSVGRPLEASAIVSSLLRIVFKKLRSLTERMLMRLRCLGEAESSASVRAAPQRMHPGTSSSCDILRERMAVRRSRDWEHELWSLSGRFAHFKVTVSVAVR